MKRIQLTLLALGGTLLCGVATGQKKALDQSAFTDWKQVSLPKISNAGRWVSYALNPALRDGATLLFDQRSDRSDTLRRATGAEFIDRQGATAWVAYRVRPTYEQLRQAKIKKLKPDQMPKDTLMVNELGIGGVGARILYIPNLKSFQVSDKLTPTQSGVLAYLYEVIPAIDTTNKDKKSPKPKKFNRLVVHNLAEGDSTVVDSVESFQLAPNGLLVLYALKADSLRSVGVLVQGKKSELYRASKGAIGTLAVDEKGRQGAYLLTSDTTTTGARYQLFAFTVKEMNPHQVAADAAQNGYVVSEYGKPRFSREGSRLEFGMAPPPRLVPKDSLPEDEKFQLDLWSYTDTLLMPQQLATLKQIKEQTFTAAYYPATGRWALLGDKYLGRIQFASDEKAVYALGSDEMPYTWSSTWDASGKQDLYRVDVRSGVHKLLATGASGRSSLSPLGSYVAWYDPETASWQAAETASGKITTLSADIPHQLYVQGHDTPDRPAPEGLAGWTADNRAVIYDNFDLWLTDPSGKRATVCLTGGVGRRDSIAFRYVRLDPEERTIDLSKSLLLSSVNQATRDEGFYQLPVPTGTAKAPTRLIESVHRYTFTAKARGADQVLYQRENFTDYRDLWLAPLNFVNPARVSTANPQQAQYKWGAVRRVQWNDLNDKPTEGLVYLPEGYDSTRRYPVIVYFYETHTPDIHKHVHPQPSWSIVVPAVCTSQDYVVFMPDIHYRTGYPGQSCYDAVVSGSLMLIDHGIADPRRMALQGQSWGGYQIAYLVTRTDMFVCASAGAPVSNMTSAFGGIRWGTGMPRMFQYEQGQSRIGGSLWENPIEYIENSPLFFANKVTTPMLMRHDDADEAVPWYQGIEYFLALRRFGVPVWMLNYNGQPHNLRSWPAKMDWDKRLMQFLDYYLKDAPLPRWMEDGLPAADKGVDQRY